MGRFELQFPRYPSIELDGCLLGSNRLPLMSCDFQPTSSYLRTLSPALIGEETRHWPRHCRSGIPLGRSIKRHAAYMRTCKTSWAHDWTDTTAVRTKQTSKRVTE
jgi:hypothetical protein